MRLVECVKCGNRFDLDMWVYTPPSQTSASRVYECPECGCITLIHKYTAVEVNPHEDTNKANF